MAPSRNRTQEWNETKRNVTKGIRNDTEGTKRNATETETERKANHKTQGGSNQKAFTPKQLFVQLRRGLQGNREKYIAG